MKSLSNLLWKKYLKDSAYTYSKLRFTLLPKCTVNNNLGRIGLAIFEIYSIKAMS